MKTKLTDLIDPSDLTTVRWPPERIGGQHVGVGSPGIKMTHKPTGMVAISTSARSQHRNRAIALAMIEGGLTCPLFQP